MTLNHAPTQVPPSLHSSVGFDAVRIMTTLATLLVTAEWFFWAHFEACGIDKQGVGEWVDALTAMWAWARGH